MIEELRIRDLGVIADATLPLGPGFTAITGETGAGKTMVVSALGLLMGERSDAGAVRAGAGQARVGGVVRVDDPAVAELVDDLGGDVEEGELVLSRTVSAEGRSRASVGGAGAPVGSLGRLAERLFAVHGQSEQLRLKSLAAQRDTIDRFGGEALAEVLREYRAAHRERQELTERVSELSGARDERAAEAARLRGELEEISGVDPQPGEEADLAQRIELLSNVEALRSATQTAHEALASDSDDPMARDAGGLVDEAVREIERVADHDRRLAAVLETLRGVSFQVADAARELAAYASDLDQEGPGELVSANERLAALNALFRVYGADSGEVVEYAAGASRRLAEIDGDDGRIDELTERLESTGARERALADRLTELRGEAATRLSELVTVELRQLALPDAEFVARVAPLETLGASGGDEVQLLLSPHPGASPRPIAKSASGGELSRVMLALEVVLAGADPVPTFVFDEVDAGVGGAAAIEIGRRLARLARTSQVIVVTHLAQVAAFANNHLQVVKDSSGGFTESSCRRLDGEERLAEMARLLSGLSDSGSALEHAAELLALRDA
ncbi:DNA repair protein RecN [Leucobacter triazinivorans]|uniref:DNA repair protein RecN n=1 Tax=Leucobacter triazinivorans TaxID=1784719 RepID=A0A4V0Z1I4_9MICO|nr:DNA repair protein RecN [Leucobacter triazinivorans]QBE48519.1 DNA repair protein RecN [Leucobacter triazinivorans]